MCWKHWKKYLQYIVCPEIVEMIVKKSIRQFSSHIIKQQLEQLASNASTPTLSQLHKYLQYDTLDAHTKFQYYFPISKSLTSYLQQIPPSLLQSHTLTSQILPLLHLYTNYPSHNISHTALVVLSQSIFRNLQLKTEEQMNDLLMFILRVDSRAGENLVFLEFLKFYLRNRMEILKGQYKVSFEGETIGSFVKKISTAVIQKSFLPRTPPYDRTLEIPQQNRPLILDLLLSNPSTSNSLMIRKLFFTQFMSIKLFFQNQMHNNLYHSKNITLWQKLNKISSGIFSQLGSIEEQAKYLRQLYITVFMVLSQKKEYDTLVKMLQKSISAYVFVRERVSEESMKGRQFLQVYEQFIENICHDEVQFDLESQLKLDRNLFLLWRQFGSLRKWCGQALEQQLVPLTMKLFIKQISVIVPELPRSFFQKMDSKYLENLTFEQYSDFITQILQRDDSKELTDVYSCIVKCILNKQDMNLTDYDILHILTIYKYRHHFVSNTHQEELQTLRVFLFRYISDNCQTFSDEPLTKIISIITNQLNDSSKFNDEHNNYPYSIQVQLYLQLVQSQEICRPWTQMLGADTRNIPSNKT